MVVEHPRENSEPGGIRLVSIVMITKDRRAQAEATVRAVNDYLDRRRERLPWRVEVLVVEEGDSPAPFAGARYRFLPRRDLGFGYARNRAVESARGDVIVFIDDDVRPCENWLEALVSPLSDASVSAVGGGVLPDMDFAGPVGMALGILGFPAGGLRLAAAAWEHPIEVRSLSTTNCAFRKKGWEEIGGFDETFVRGCEDADFFRRLRRRGRLVFVGAACGRHRQREHPGDVFRWAVRRGRAYFCLDAVERSLSHAVLGSPLHFFPGKAAAAVLASLLVGAVSHFIAGIVLLAGVLCAWFGAVMFRTARILKRAGGIPALAETVARAREPDTLAMLPIVKLLMDIGEPVGRFLMWREWNDMHRRHARRPVVRAYGLPEEEGEQSRGQGEDDAIRLEREVRNITGMRGRTITLDELAWRLRERPRSLHFQPLSAPVVAAGHPRLTAAARRLVMNGARLTVIVPAPGDDGRLPSSRLRSLFLESTGAGVSVGVLWDRGSWSPAGPAGVSALLRECEQAYGGPVRGVLIPPETLQGSPRDAAPDTVSGDVLPGTQGCIWIALPGDGRLPDISRPRHRKKGPTSEGTDVVIISYLPSRASPGK